MSDFAIYHVKSEIISNEGIIGAPALKHNEAKCYRLFEVVFDFLLATQRFNKIFSDLRKKHSMQ